MIVLGLLVLNKPVRELEMLQPERINLEKYGGGDSEVVTVLISKGPIITELEIPTGLVIGEFDDDEVREFLLTALLFWLLTELQ